MRHLGGILVVWIFTMPAFGVDYMDQYNRGSLAIQLGNCEEGEPLMQEVLKINSKGDFRKNYFPQYYLAVCALNRDEPQEAQKLAKQAEGGGIAFSGLAKEYSKFKTQLQAKLKESKSGKMVLVVIVHPDNAVNDITREKLCRIYKGEEKTWEDGVAIQPALYAASSSENRIFLKSVCAMDEKAIIDLWQNQDKTPPSAIEKTEWILRFVFSNPGAIAFYPAGAAAKQVKVIRVEGKESTDPAYPISASAN